MRLITESIPAKTNVHKNLLPALRIVLALAATIYVLWTLYGLSRQGIFLRTSTLEFGISKALWLLLTLVLMTLNWGLEVLKWKILTQKLEPLKFLTLIKGVLFGISLGMITPKRSGEFAGRVMVLKPQHRLQGILLNTASSLSQLIITLTMGSLGLVWLWHSFATYPGNDSALMAKPATILWIGFVVALMLILLLFRLPSLARFHTKPAKGLLQRLWQHLNIFTTLTAWDTGRLIILSFLRYIVFIFQFYLLLKIFGLPVSAGLAFTLIAVVYLFMTLIPLSAIWELGVRGSVAIFVFGIAFSHIGYFEASVVAASTTLWAINLAIPALAGGLWGLRQEFGSSNE